MEKTCQQSNPSAKEKRLLWVLIYMPRILAFLLVILMTVSIFLFVSIRYMRHNDKIRQHIEPLIKQGLELSEQIDTQQAAVNDEYIRVAHELKKPKEEQAADLDKRIQLNAERTEAIQKLIKQQRELLDTLRKRQEELGIVPKKESSEAKAAMEKY